MYFAAISELFGQPKTSPQNEETIFKPRTHMQYINSQAYGQFAHTGKHISSSWPMGYSVTMNQKLGPGIRDT